MFSGIGMSELIVIFLILLLLFGAKRLPEIARSLGKATTEFKKAKDEITNYSETPSKPQYQQAPQQYQQQPPQQTAQQPTQQNNNNQPQA